MPLSMGSLAKALRLDKDDKRRAKVKFSQGEGEKHDRLELEQERKKFNRKVKDITLRSKDDEIIRIRTLERQQNHELDKKMKKTEKNIEAVIRMQKNRDWRRKREECSASRLKLENDKLDEHDKFINSTDEADDQTLILPRKDLERLSSYKAQLQSGNKCTRDSSGITESKS